MARSKEARPREFFESQIRSLKKENSQLRKRIQQLENLIGDPEIKEDRKQTRIKVEENKCPSCAKGTITEMEFAGRVFEVCYLCKYRKKIKALKKKR